MLPPADMYQSSHMYLKVKEVRSIKPKIGV